MALLLRLPAFLAFLSLLASTPAPHAATETIARVRELSASAARSRVTVHGVVTRYRRGTSLSLQDATGSLFAYTTQLDPLAPGDVVEVAGDTAIDSEGAPCVEAATYVKIGHGAPPAAVAATVADLDAGRFEAALVTVEGTLERIETARYEHALIIVSGETELTAWLLRDAAMPAPHVAVGSRVRVAGIVSRTNEPDGRSGFELLMRTPADVVVLKPPPLWTSGHFAAIAAGLAGATVILLSYAFLLRRQVRRQTATIAERLRAEADLKEQYRQAQKMEAVGRLAGGIAHDFNNIMTVVVGHADMLALELDDCPELLESIDEIRHASARAAGVTRQLLAFGRRQHLETAAVDLNAVISAMATLLKRVLGGDIAVHAEVVPQPVIVTIDRGQLEQALLNLAVNARDAMPEGGRLTLSVDAEGEAGKRVAVLRVADTGSGIPAEAQPHVFDPFFTTKDVGRGSGLGLAMVYGFVQQTGGTIRFETAERQGTTFELTFPLSDPVTS